MLNDCKILLPFVILNVYLMLAVFPEDGIELTTTNIARTTMIKMIKLTLKTKQKKESTY